MIAISSLSRSEFVGWLSNNVVDYNKLIALFRCKVYLNQIDCMREHNTYDELTNNLQNILKDNSDLKEALNKYKGNIIQLNNEIRKKKKIINDYEEKFEKMEEEMQSALEKKTTAQVESGIIQLQMDIKNLREEKELVQISKEKHVNDLIQLNLDNKKRINILENNIKILIKEKNELETKMSNRRLSVKFKQWANQETQTEYIEDNVHEYNNLINEELDKLREKYTSASKELRVVKQIKEEREKELKEMKEEIEKLKIENVDLKIRREAAMEEIKRLNVNLLKLNCHSSDSSSACKKSQGKVRYSSEAVSFLIRYRLLL